MDTNSRLYLFQAIVNRCVNVHFRVIRVKSREFRSDVDFATTEATFMYGFSDLLFVPIHGCSIFMYTMTTEP